jgi:chorismate mutase
MVARGERRMSPADQVALHAVRTEIEQVDEAIMAAIARRMELARAVRAVKARAGQPVLDPAREAAVVTRASARAREAGLPEDDVRALYWKIIAMSRKAQTGAGRAEG